MMEDISLWKVGEIVIGAVLAWGMFVIRAWEKKFDEQNAKIQMQAERIDRFEERLFEMQTKFVTEDQMNSKFEPIQEDLKEVKNDIKTLISRSV